MSRSSACVLIATVLWLALGGLCGAEAAEPIRKPNIVLIFIDDMGYADVGCFGADDLRTPHIDRLAAEGMKFTSYYAAPVCSMSRASLMTGCYNVRVSVPGVLYPDSEIGLNPDEVTVAEVLKSRGYATACIGKWHLGDRPAHLPTRQGFDEYFGIPYSNDMGLTTHPKRNFPPLPMMQGETVIETEPDQSQLTRRYTEQAVRFITEHKDGPFFLYLPHSMVHIPLDASEPFKGKSKRGIYGDAVEEIDWSVGRIMAVLDELSIADQTLVMFTSDNGPASQAQGSAKPLRGRKESSYEGGMREPTIIRWPGHVPAGTVCDRIVGNIDVLPTFAALAEAPLPKDRTLDGRDFSSLLTNPDGPSVRRVQLYHVRSGAAQAIRIDDYKLRIHRNRVELFNLADDIRESKNLASAMPQKVAELRAELHRRDQDIRQHQRPPGRAEAIKPPMINTRPGSEYADADRKFQGIPSIARAPGGRLWAAWYGGGKKEGPNNYIMLSTSGDDGQNWSDLKLVVDPPFRASEPAVWVDPGGRLWLAINLYPKGLGGGDTQMWAVTTDDPDQADPTWSKPRLLARNLNNFNKPIVLKSGAWLWPAGDWWMGRDLKHPSRPLLSDDQGRSFQPGGPVLVPPKVREFDEYNVVELRDGRLWLLTRTTSGRPYESFSSDGGKTWSPATASATIRHTHSRHFLTRLRSGNLMLIKHGPIDQNVGRSQLMAFVSSDEGRTWQGGLMLDEREQVSYPDGCQAPDGTIYVAYDYERTGASQILMARFTEADVLAGRVVSDGAALRCVINDAAGQP
ncbi:sulfatase-like hydrolase/transferase [Planctomycetales bacterium ZRK34]|nr:sulfatase-like hydrolase/transferase [Planctomycetales bacterium ZRK34]